jgi:NAD(P)-dependent dehydrogenase (short-subunit alcohol dehydrogenase family)
MTDEPRKPSPNLDGRTAIVTGAARGLGLAIAERLGDAGARLLIADLDSDELARAATELGKRGFEVTTVAGNVAEEETIARVNREALARFGRIDILVNNAGGSAHTPLRIEDVTTEHFDRVIDWNLRSSFFLIQKTLPALRSQGGSIVNMASIAGRAGCELVSPQYSAVKAGIVGLTRNLAHHLGPDGIRVNAIAPGFIKSGPRAEAIWQSRDETKVLGRVPLRRRGEMDDIAAAALFLASDESRYVTGVVLDVNGGFMTA